MKIKLNERLQKIADMVIPGGKLADIGTDHAYIPAYLLSEGIIPYAVLSDVAEMPLSRAAVNFKNAGIEKDSYVLRRGNGLAVLSPAEVSSVIIAGMGGELIQSLLERDYDKAHSFSRIILQPRTKCDELRLHLKAMNFEICDYAIAEENGRLCEIFAVIPEQNPCEENPVISDLLLKKGDEHLCEFIEYKIKSRYSLIENLKQSLIVKQDDKINKTLKEIEYLRSLL